MAAIESPQSATRRQHEQTPEYRNAYRWRSGIESTHSCLKRRLGLKRLRVRGVRAVQLAVYLKLAGWNLLRAIARRAVTLTTLAPTAAVAAY